MEVVAGWCTYETCNAHRYLYHLLEKWETLPKALFECSQSPNAAHRESAFRIFATVPELISDQHVDALKAVFLTSLTDAESQEVSISAHTPGERKGKDLFFVTLGPLGSHEGRCCLYHPSR